jgi:rhodanese-related sulfurtransferase
VVDVRRRPATGRGSGHGRPGAIRTPARGTARRRWASVVAGIVLLVAAGCGGADDEEEGTTGGPPAVDLVGPDAFAERLADPDALVVNVHVPYEGEIAGTDLFVPFDEIASSPRLPSEKDRPLVLYCRTGNMSAEAAAALVDAGYTDVTDLEGGMVAWETSSRPIEVVPERAEATEATG